LNLKKSLIIGFSLNTAHNPKNWWESPDSCRVDPAQWCSQLLLGLFLGFQTILENSIYFVEDARNMSSLSKVTYQGQQIFLKEKQALTDLEKLFNEPIPATTITNTFKFGFTAKNGVVSSLGLPKKGIVSLPVSIGNLTALQELILFSNHLETLPESFGNLKSLKFLNLVSNKLTALPESFTQLESLQILFLNQNRLSILPKTFGYLKALQRLNLRSNRLQSLPASLLELANLEFIWIDDDMLKEDAQIILRKLKRQNVIINGT
jgi:Leucine-rich repeat (LRR) protein